MQCSRCNTENDTFRRFCRQCGAPLGMMCDRCGHVNGYNDVFCGMCGRTLRLPAEEGGGKKKGADAAQGEARQYSPEDIEELLSLRNVILKEEVQATGLKQEDIDKLFE